MDNKSYNNKLYNDSNTKKHDYLKKGEGKLASQFHGETKFAIQRKQKILKENKTFIVINSK